ncbi:hypothetical protein QVD17_14853 [Tagetes erecta]|uniref:F-box domain-containing protein n=1 Tax=Tagetes erecta TaxID=13708 RepID=A0AAD8NZ44_TARER|nr:hypothetical protein QVD17_14853 [Tagetes erecta]
MSDNIPPLDIQIEILTRLPVKSLIQFRSVSKTWKSIIDTSDFIAAHHHHHTQQQHHLLVYCDDPNNYVAFVDNHSFPQHKFPITIPFLLNKFQYRRLIGSSRGLFCFYGEVANNPEGSVQPMVVIWNPSIRRVIQVLVPGETSNLFRSVLGFGVCPITNDPKIIKIRFISGEDNLKRISHVEVFTLSTRTWRSSYSNLPPKFIYYLDPAVDVDGFLYWQADDMIASTNVIISFDLTSEEFRQVNLPDKLAREDCHLVSTSKIRECLVVSHHDVEGDDFVISVWLMEGGLEKSFSKLYSVNVSATRHTGVRGFRRNGEPIIDVVKEVYEGDFSCFKFGGMCDKFVVHSYMETLLLLDQTNLTAYDETESVRFLDDSVL